MKHEIEKTALNLIGKQVRKPVRMVSSELVKSELLHDHTLLPLVIKPAIEGVNLATWAKANLEAINENLDRHGGILFRGFKVNDQSDFEHFLDAIGLMRMQYLEGATPRHELGNHIYTSTQFPAEHAIALHNELSYVLTWPMKVAFFCLEPAEIGGETPIADVRKVFWNIAPEIRQRFIDANWMLVRNFGDGFSLPWQKVFHTNDKMEVERYCRDGGIEWEWKDRMRLRTRQVRPATAIHPRTNETLWFNHIAFWHCSSLDAKTREMLVSEYGESELPYNTYYGGGTAIEDSVIQEIRRAYDAETVRFAWQRSDVLLLDNMLVAHGRGPYVGSRKVIVSMGDPFRRT